MFSHVMIGANSIEESKAFYDAVLGTIGYKPGFVDPKGRCFYMAEGNVFGLSVPIDGNPACNGNGSTIGFKVGSPEVGDAWHAAGLAHGGTTCEDPPGIREDNGIYLAYLRDPAGNKICVVHRPS